uniref:Bm1811 n=1 Tax=Brugia malayi TaxID=6279 RepID=A0A1I9GDU9_BRUMA|nr:Bm1811 [Brugia malayi]
MEIPGKAGKGDDVPIQKIFCEGEEANLECPIGRYIAIRLANYGRFTLGLCNPSHRTDLSTTCQNDRTLAIMKLR